MPESRQISAAFADHPEFVPQIQYIDIDLLEENTGQLSKTDPVSGEQLGLPRNPRFIRDERFRALKKSITDDPEYLLYSPLKIYPLAGGRFIIVGGNQRRRACKELGFKKVPCLVFLEDTPMPKLRAWAIKDNLAFGNDDYEILANEWDQEELEAAGMELDWVAPPDEGEEEGAGERTDGEDDEYDVDQKVEERVHRGEIWALGPHRLMCGDSTDAGDFERLMAGEKADLWLTDPPYNVNYGADMVTKDGGDRTIENDNMSESAFLEFLTEAFQNASEAMKEGAAAYVFHADSHGLTFRQAVQDVGFELRQCLIWAKDTLSLSRQDYHWRHEPALYFWKSGASHHWYSDRTQTTVLEFDRPKKSELHPTMKPIPLFVYLIQNSSKKGDIVLDSFGGSGTTIIACEQTGRIGYTMELDEHYASVIVDRWEKYTGKKAERIE